MRPASRKAVRFVRVEPAAAEFPAGAEDAPACYPLRISLPPDWLKSEAAAAIRARRVRPASGRRPADDSRCASPAPRRIFKIRPTVAARRPCGAAWVEARSECECSEGREYRAVYRPEDPARAEEAYRLRGWVTTGW